MERPDALRNNFALMRSLVDEFWHRWIKEYLPTIAGRSKWFEDPRDLREGESVIVVDESTRNGWLRGRVLSVVKGCDGRVRQAYVKTPTGVLRRPTSKIAILDIQDKSSQHGFGKAGQTETIDQHYGSGYVGGTTPLSDEVGQLRSLDSS